MGLLEKTIRELSEAIETINHSRETAFNPTITLFSSIIFVSAVTFTDNLLLLISVIVICLIVPPIVGIDADKFYKLFMFSSFFLLLVSLYLIFDPKYIFAEINAFFIRMSVEVPFYVLFIMRSLSAIVVFEIFIAYLGIRNIVRCLEQLRIPRKIIALFLFFVVFLNRNLRSVSRKVLARYSRILVRGLRREWRLLSSIVGDLFIGSVQASQRFVLGLRSRGFDMEAYRIETHNIGWRDIFLTSIAILAFILAYI